MSRQSDGVKRWRMFTKHRIVESMGGCCQVCGYSKCDSALELHHKDPEAKELSFGKLRANPKAWKKLVEELKKCVLLCSNCHREIHDGITALPKNIKEFDESFSDYQKTLQEARRKNLFDNCPVCGKEKRTIRRYCSLICSGKSKQRVDWDSIDLLELKRTMSNNRIAESLDISEAAVRKRLKRSARRG